MLSKRPGGWSTRRRTGLSLTELMIVLVLLGIVGTALTRLLVQQSRIFSRQQGQRESRLVTRNGLNLVLSELRTAQDTLAVDLVGSDHRSVRVELPYVFGVACGSSGGATIVRTSPMDSAIQSNVRPAGYRWRNSGNGLWVTLAGAFQSQAGTAADSTVCAGAGVLPLSSAEGRPGLLLRLQPDAAVPAGTLVSLVQRVTYSFAPTTVYSGGYGLFRSTGATNEELLGPFDSTARFRYFVPNSDVAVNAVPAPISQIRGLEFVLHGRSERAVRQVGGGQLSAVSRRDTVAVYFKNTRRF
ncbi:MAG: PilW family protein [Gemmatimonadaceae bacterium]